MAGHSESKIAVIAAVAANLIIAVIKFIAAAMTGSSAMIAEGIHSLVDTGNGGLVLMGMKRSTQPPDAEHPFGHSMELYFWTLIVAISIFGIGGGMSVYEGILHILHPSPLENPLVNYVVLAVSFVVEGASFFVAMRQFGRARGKMSALTFVRQAKDPSLFTIVFEDSAAMLGLIVAFLGVFLGHTFHNPYFDGGASIVIGLLLMTVAWVLASETKGLLIGEGVLPADLERMKAIVRADADVEDVGEIRTMYFGPHDLLVNLDVAFKAGLSGEQVHDAVTRVDDALCASDPNITRVYIEVKSIKTLLDAAQAATEPV